MIAILSSSGGGEPNRPNIGAQVGEGVVAVVLRPPVGCCIRSYPNVSR